MSTALQMIDSILSSLNSMVNEDDAKVLNELTNLRIDCGNCELRFIADSDTEAIVRAANSKHVVKYLRDRFPHPYRTEDAKWWINRNKASLDKYTKVITMNGDNDFCEIESLCLQIVDKKDVIIGGIGLERHQFEWHKYELGYWLNENYWNQGITTNAVRGIINFVWSDNNDIAKKLKLSKIIRIEAFIAAENVGSSKVCTKCGFKQEGFHRKGHKYRDGSIGDEYSFAIVREDYASIY